MKTENSYQQEAEKKKWATPELKVYGNVVEITAEMVGGGKSPYSS
jgi:hypothetical protein